MKVCSIFSQVLKLFSRGGSRRRSSSTRPNDRTTGARFHQLGPVHRHVVLPGGTGAFPARDLWGPPSPKQASSLPCQFPSPPRSSLAFLFPYPRPPDGPHIKERAARPALERPTTGQVCGLKTRRNGTVFQWLTTAFPVSELKIREPDTTSIGPVDRRTHKTDHRRKSALARLPILHLRQVEQRDGLTFVLQCLCRFDSLRRVSHRS